MRLCTYTQHLCALCALCVRRLPLLPSSQHSQRGQTRVCLPSPAGPAGGGRRAAGVRPTAAAVAPETSLFPWRSRQVSDGVVFPRLPPTLPTRPPVHMYSRRHSSGGSPAPSGQAPARPPAGRGGHTPAQVSTLPLTGGNCGRQGS